MVKRTGRSKVFILCLSSIFLWQPNGKGELRSQVAPFMGGKIILISSKIPGLFFFYEAVLFVGYGISLSLSVSDFLS